MQLVITLQAFRSNGKGYSSKMLLLLNRDKADAWLKGGLVEFLDDLPKQVVYDIDKNIVDYRRPDDSEDAPAESDSAKNVKAADASVPAASENASAAEANVNVPADSGNASAADLNVGKKGVAADKNLNSAAASKKTSKPKSKPKAENKSGA